MSLNYFRAYPLLSLRQATKCVNIQPGLFEFLKRQLPMAPNGLRGSSTRPTTSLLKPERWTVLAIGGQDGLLLWISSRARTCDDQEFLFIHHVYSVYRYSLK